MLKLAFWFSLLSTLAAHAASLQDPTVTIAYYTSRYTCCGQYLQLNSINNNGLAVGEFLMPGKNSAPYQATTFQDGTYSPIYGVPNAINGTRLTSINDSGTYIGYGAPQGSTAFSGFIGVANGGFSPATSLNVPGAVSTFPSSINDAGTVVGGYISSIDGREHGFIYSSNGTFQTLDDPALASTALVGINNHGQIVGTLGSGTTTYPSTELGFLYSGGSFVQFTYGTPTAINDSGAIAINAPGLGGGGILYQDGTFALASVYNLGFNDSSIGPGITALNNQGTIIFPSAGPFIATPNAPEPASAGLLLIGAVAFFTVRISQRQRTKCRLNLHERANQRE